MSAPTDRREVRDDDALLLLLDPVYRLPEPMPDYPPAPAEPIPGFRLVWPNAATAA